MILGDHDIVEALDAGAIRTDPHPEPEQVQPASLDVRLGDTFKKEGMSAPWQNSDEVVLEPGVRYLGTTEETVTLPNDIAAQLSGRSTVARRGVIVHKTAGWIDPGFAGEITLELLNMSSEPVTLGVGSRVAQLVFHELKRPSSGYDGQYQGQSGPTKGGEL